MLVNAVQMPGLQARGRRGQLNLLEKKGGVGWEWGLGWWMG